MKRISILNFKGGVGKTSISTNSAHKLALLGHKVLLIDCDIQANASNLILQKDRKPTTLTHVLKGEATFEEAIQQARDNLFLIAADSNLDKAANHIVISGIKGYKLLRNATRSLTGFDFVIFDHSPFYTAISPTASFNSLVHVLVRKSAVTARSWLTSGTLRWSWTPRPPSPQVMALLVVKLRFENNYLLRKLFK